MRIRLLGGLQVTHDSNVVAVSGAMQLAVLFRLAVDAGSAVSYRAISEDVWGTDAPENARAALQSIVSRLRSQLPSSAIESTVGGYRLNVGRADVDALAFTDLVAAASAATRPDEAASIASEALALWSGEPWIPSENFDWFERDLRRDRRQAIELGGSMPTSPHSSIAVTLPVPITSLVGRATELATIAAQLDGNRLVTIIGTGGAGKTRLAIEAASHRRAAILVELAPVGPQEVASAVLAATGREIRMADNTSESLGTRERLLEALSGRETLLVLDNCEHVIDATARLAQDLLTALPQLRILSTSREPLGIAGEAFVGIGALSHPTEGEIASVSSDGLAGFAAIELFCQRATAASGRSPQSTDLPVIASICARLDGLPLAIELAAAKLRTMTAEEIFTGLEDRFTLLSGGLRSALPRHQTLRAMIDWSWSLLNNDERRALVQFSVFPAGVSASEAQELAREAGLLSSAVFDSLVDKSLLQRSRGRFRALETVREYGSDRLAESGKQVDARTLHARFMAARAREFDRLLRGPRIMDAIDWFDAEEDNISSALRFATGLPLPEVAVSLAVSCGWYWLIRDRGEEARTWLSAVGPLAKDVGGDEGRILSLVHPLLQAFANAGSEVEEMPSDELLQELGAIITDLGEIPLGAGSHELLQLLGPTFTAFAGVVGKPDWMIEVELPNGDELGLDPWPTAILDVARAAMSQNRGEVAELGSASQLAVERFTKIGDLWGLALSQQMHAEWLTLEGRLDEALETSDASTENMRRITSSWDLAQQQGLAITLLTRLGRVDEARARAEEQLRAAEADGNARAVVQAQITVLGLDIVQKDVAAAGSRIAAIDELLATWPVAFGQVVAGIEAAKSAVAVLRGDFGAAENHLRDAADAAIRSHDQPIIGMVAVHVGTLALARGDIAEAVRAVNIACAMIGAYDSTNPQIRAIAEAAAHAGIGQPGSNLPNRPIAIESLKALLDA